MATAHIPPKTVYKRTVNIPNHIPDDWLIAPLLITLKTKPKAVIWAATQPKYETIIAKLVMTSTFLPYLI